MNKLKLSIILIVAVVLQFSKAANDVCDNRFNVVSSITREDCPPDIKDETGKTLFKYYVFQNGGEHKCFPYCQQVKMEMAGDQFCGINLPCPPGYLCEGDDYLKKHCILDQNSCFKYYANYDSKDQKFFDAQWKPECLPNGEWAPKQCKGESFTGRCFCYDPVGNRIDGHQWTTKSENMTCACSRKRAELSKDPNNLFVSLHCDDEGNYESLQCNDGQCWCADPKTGVVISKIVGENMMKILPCYDVVQNGDQYLRQCESQLYAQKKIVSQLRTHGTIGFHYENILCDSDGTYGIYKIADGRATCVWKDNTQIGSFQLVLKESASDIRKMTCKCARDQKIYEMAGLDPAMKGECDPMGNYEPIQIKILEGGEKKYYCVDTDGFQSSPLSDTKPTTCA